MFEHSGKTRVREAMIAGIFYPEEATLLAAEIRRLLDAAPEPPRRGASAIVSPHAGLGYSGDLSAQAWKSAIGRRIERLVILSPQHHSKEQGIFLPESDFFECPLGPLGVDLDMLDELEDCGTLFYRTDVPHLEEHGIEVQLPFARLLFPDASIVPILLGKPSLATVKALAAGLGLVFGPRAETSLVVISTDLESGLDEAKAEGDSSLLLDLVLAGDWRGIFDRFERGELGACGAGCLAAYLASSLAEPGRLLGRHDSSKSRETREELMVHYAALAFGGREEGG